jgi:hypothetical protein
MTLSRQGSPHMMGSTTSFHRDDADGEFGAKGDHRLTPHAASDRNLSDQIKANKAAAILSEINAEYCDFHGSAPPQC